jgi:arylsulfatase A-like enzyme
MPVPEWKPTPAVFEDTAAEKADKVPFLRSAKSPESFSRFQHDGHMRTLAQVDDTLDKLFRELEAKGELDNTLVIFTSDNGYSWGERGVPSKGLPYTESVRVPFLVRWPGVFGAGVVDPRYVSGVDFLPTILDATGITPPQLHYPLDGRSFLPGRPGRDQLLLEFHFGHRDIHTWASLRTDRWQYIEYYQNDGTTIEWREYYDLLADPWQLDSMLADNTPANDPDVTALSATLARARQCAGGAGGGACP